MRSWLMFLTAFLRSGSCLLFLSAIWSNAADKSGWGLKQHFLKQNRAISRLPKANTTMIVADTQIHRGNKMVLTWHCWLKQNSERHSESKSQ